MLPRQLQRAYARFGEDTFTMTSLADAWTSPPSFCGRPRSPCATWRGGSATPSRHTSPARSDADTGFHPRTIAPDRARQRPRYGGARRMSTQATAISVTRISRQRAQERATAASRFSLSRRRRLGTGAGRAARRRRPSGGACLHCRSCRGDGRRPPPKLVVLGELDSPRGALDLLENIRGHDPEAFRRQTSSVATEPPGDRAQLTQDRARPTAGVRGRRR